MQLSSFKQLLKNDSKKSFLERLVAIDFERLYTTKTRIACHLFMWVSLSVLILLNLVFAYKFPWQGTLVFLMRSLVCNVIVFYMFFYVVMPDIISRGWLFLIFFYLLAAVCLWVFVDHWFMYLIHKWGFSMESDHFNQRIKRMAERSMAEVFSIENLSGDIMNVLYAVSPFFFTKVVFDLIRYFSRLAKVEQQRSLLEIQNISIEKDFLKAQLNPHFLFNTLNNLYRLVEKKDEMAHEAVLQLSQMMRYTLYQSSSEKVALQKEIDFIQNYVALEKMRYTSNRPITLIITGDARGLDIAPLLTFTFIENAFKYALKNKNTGYIKIKIDSNRNFFYFTIENDLKKVEQKENDYGGIGLKNVEKRLELLYPTKYNLEIEKKDASFRVSMKIDLK